MLNVLKRRALANPALATVPRRARSQVLRNQASAIAPRQALHLAQCRVRCEDNILRRRRNCPSACRSQLLLSIRRSVPTSSSEHIWRRQPPM
jgi:hypothetical protein